MILAPQYMSHTQTIIIYRDRIIVKRPETVFVFLSRMWGFYNPECHEITEGGIGIFQIGLDHDNSLTT